MDHMTDLLQHKEEAKSIDELKSNSPIAPATRQIRVTLEPASSIIIAFMHSESHRQKNIVLMDNFLHLKNNQSVDFFKCSLNHFYYTGQTVTEMRPLGGIEGLYTQEIDVKALSKGDTFGCRLLHDEIPGATIKVEIYDNVWKTIIFEKITSAYKKHKITW